MNAEKKKKIKKLYTNSIEVWMNSKKSEVHYGIYYSLVRERLFASKDGHKVTQYTKIELSWVENERRFSTALQTRQIYLIHCVTFFSSSLVVSYYWNLSYCKAHAIEGTFHFNLFWKFFSTKKNYYKWRCNGHYCSAKYVTVKLRFLCEHLALKWSFDVG